MITLYEVHQTFLKYDLHKYKKNEQNPKPRCRYEALYTFQIWHADFHAFTDIKQNQYYLYTIIDDRSRLIVDHSIINNKSQDETIKVIKNAIYTYGRLEIM